MSTKDVLVGRGKDMGKQVPYKNDYTDASPVWSKMTIRELAACELVLQHLQAVDRDNAGWHSGIGWGSGADYQGIDILTQPMTTEFVFQASRLYGSAVAWASASRYLDDWSSIGGNDGPDAYSTDFLTYTLSKMSIDELAWSASFVEFLATQMTANGWAGNAGSYPTADYICHTTTGLRDILWANLVARQGGN
jgi:hypothetical protein